MSADCCGTVSVQLGGQFTGNETQAYVCVGWFRETIPNGVHTKTKSHNLFFFAFLVDCSTNFYVHTATYRTEVAMDSDYKQVKHYDKHVKLSFPT